MFLCAYPQTQQEALETENMARTMLANQFAASLKHEITVKVAGVKGSFEKLLQIARFEEAKLRDLPYTYKFSRDVIFKLFPVNWPSAKFSSLKFHWQNFS